MDRYTKSKPELPQVKKQATTSTSRKSRIPILKNSTYRRPRYSPIRRRNTRRWGVAMLSEDNMKLLSTTTARLSYDPTTLEALEGRPSPTSSSTSSEHCSSSSGSIPIILDLHHMLDTAVEQTTLGAPEHASKPTKTKPIREEMLETIDEDAEQQEQGSLHDSLLEDPSIPPIPKRHPARKRATLLTLKEMLATPHEEENAEHVPVSRPDSLLNSIASGTFDSDLATIQTYIHGSARLAKTSTDVARMHMVRAEKAAKNVDIEKKFVAFMKLMSELHKEEAKEAREELEEKKREFSKTSEGVEVLLSVGKLGVH